MTLRNIIENSYGTFLCVFLLLFLSSCASQLTEPPVVSSSSGWLEKYPVPPTAVILPFENITPEKDLAKFVRESFYGHFSAKNYRDIELSEVDRILEIHRETASQAWRELSPDSLGALFHTDLLIYGKVLGYKRYFAGVYSQIALEIGIEMVECKTGEGVWRKTQIKRSHDGGIPFSPLETIPASIRSGYHFRKEGTVILVDRAIREIVGDIPNPAPIEISPFSVEIQVASFLQGDLAEEAMKGLEQRGLAVRIETAPLKGHIWHRLLLGPYEDRGKAERIKTAIERDTAFTPFLVHCYNGRKANSEN